MTLCYSPVKYSQCGFLWEKTVFFSFCLVQFVWSLASRLTGFAYYCYYFIKVDNVVQCQNLYIKRTYLIIPWKEPEGWVDRERGRENKGWAEEYDMAWASMFHEMSRQPNQSIASVFTSLPLKHFAILMAVRAYSSNWQIFYFFLSPSIHCLTNRVFLFFLQFFSLLPLLFSNRRIL